MVHRCGGRRAVGDPRRADVPRLRAVRRGVRGGVRLEPHGAVRRVLGPDGGERVAGTGAGLRPRSLRAAADHDGGDHDLRDRVPAAEPDQHAAGVLRRVPRDRARDEHRLDDGRLGRGRELVQSSPRAGDGDHVARVRGRRLPAARGRLVARQHRVARHIRRLGPGRALRGAAAGRADAAPPGAVRLPRRRRPAGRDRRRRPHRTGRRRRRDQLHVAGSDAHARVLVDLDRPRVRAADHGCGHGALRRAPQRQPRLLAERGRERDPADHRDEHRRHAESAASWATACRCATSWRWRCWVTWPR